MLRINLNFFKILFKLYQIIGNIGLGVFIIFDDFQF